MRVWIYGKLLKYHILFQKLLPYQIAWNYGFCGSVSLGDESVPHVHEREEATGDETGVS